MAQKMCAGTFAYTKSLKDAKSGEKMLEKGEKCWTGKIDIKKGATRTTLLLDSLFFSRPFPSKKNHELAKRGECTTSGISSFV